MTYPKNAPSNKYTTLRDKNSILKFSHLNYSLQINYLTKDNGFLQSLEFF